MVRIEHPEKYILLRFEKGTNNTKYNAVLQNKITKREKRVPFGDVRYQHYKDLIGLYTDLNHLNKKRRESFKARHGDNAKFKYSSAWFSLNYLW
jgi:hypothetical protein